MLAAEIATAAPEPDEGDGSTPTDPDAALRRFVEQVTAASARERGGWLGWIVPAPATVPLDEGAAVPTAGMTALALLDIADIGDGSTVLIVGATGGVGSASAKSGLVADNLACRSAVPSRPQAR